VKIEFEGRTWEFDEDEVTVKQAMVLHLTYKMTLKDWIEGLGQVDQRALHFTYWLMLQQNGVVKPIADCDPKVIAFGVAFAEARQADSAEPEPEPDPTSPLPADADPPSAGSAFPTATTLTPPAPDPSTVS
jgi:hypothetical protein